MYNLAHVFLDYNLAFFLFLLITALVCTTLDQLRSVFFCIIFGVLLKFLVNSTYPIWIKYVTITEVGSRPVK